MPVGGRINKSATIIVLTDAYHDYQKLIVDSIAGVLEGHGYGTVCVAGRELADDKLTITAQSTCNSIYTLVQQCDVRGVICLSGTIGHSVEAESLEAFLSQFNVPLVSLGLSFAGVSSVVIDDRAGMVELMSHLISDVSRQNFAFVRGYPLDPYSLEREEIFRSMLLEHGREVNESLFIEGQYDAFESYRAVQALLESDVEIHAIVAANDIMALSAARAITAKKLKIPDDIVVTGFDDRREATHISPALTTVRQPIVEMAQSGAELILGKIQALKDDQQEAATSADIVHVHSELILRGSTLSESPNVRSAQIHNRLGLETALRRSMSGLIPPNGVDIGVIARALWQTITTDSNQLSGYFESKLIAPIAFEDVHWWSNLCHQIELHTARVMERTESSDRKPFVLCSLAKVRERVWSVSLDHEFELHRFENAQTSMQLQMSSCTDFDGILDVMAEWLKALNVNRCFLIRFETPARQPSEFSQVIYVGDLDRTVEFSGEHFPTTNLLPTDLSYELAKGLLVLNPIYAGSDLYGYMLIDPTGLDHPQLETTAHSIGNAMRSQYLINTLEQQTSNLQSANRELFNLAKFDTLTGLPNRLNFQQRLQDLCELAKEQNSRFALLFIDLDGFKHINDTLGHDSGDRLLRSVSRRLSKLVSTLENDSGFVARLGGDEFTLTIELNNTTIDVEEFSERILETLARSFILQGHVVNVSGSVGCAFFPDNGADTETLVKHADTAMYKAKQRGKNCLAFYEPEMSAVGNAFLRLDQEMRSALVKSEFNMHYQPKIDLGSGKICGVEALMRWIVDTPGGPETKAYPDEFIPVAEATGFIAQLDVFALEESCRVARQWELSGHALSMAVNLSVVLLQRENIVEIVKMILERCELTPSLLELEITESAVMTEVEKNVHKLGLLRDLGVRIAVDDFGTGYSSLNYLKRLPINSLKIDRSFVADLVSDSDEESVDAAIIRSVVALGKSMDLTMVAEGVETQEQLDMVAALGCDQAQGYFFARPQPLESLQLLLEVQFEHSQVA